MKKIKLMKNEKEIERALIRGEYRPVSKAELDDIVQAVSRRKKDAVLNVRVNGKDLENIKRKARRLGVAYQTFISEILHRFAA